MFYLRASAPPVPAEGPNLCRPNEHHEWSYGLEKHRAAIRGAKGSIDQAVPRSINHELQGIQARTRQFCEDQKKAEIGRENRKLVDRLHTIAKRGAGRDPRAPPPAKDVMQGLPRGALQPHAASAGSLLTGSSSEHRTRSLNDLGRKETQRVIDLDNAGMVRRILAAKGSDQVDPARHGRDFNRHRRAVQNLQKLPYGGSAPGGSRHGPPAPRTLPPLKPPRPASHAAVQLVGLEGLLLPGDLLRRSASGPASLMGTQPLSPIEDTRPAHASTAPVERQSSSVEVTKAPRPTTDLVGQEPIEEKQEGPNEPDWQKDQEESDRRRWLAEQEASRLSDASPSPKDTGEASELHDTLAPISSPLAPEEEEPAPRASGPSEGISQLTGMSTTSLRYDQDWDEESMSNMSPGASQTSGFKSVKSDVKSQKSKESVLDTTQSSTG